MEQQFTFLEGMKYQNDIYRKMLLFFLAHIIFFNIYGQDIKNEFYNDGSIKRTYATINDSILHGEDTSYYSNGVIKEIKIWNEGKLKDSIVKYNILGKIISVGYIQKDSLFFVRRDGTKEFEVGLNNGIKNGLETHYGNNDDEIRAFKNFEEGVDNGLSIIFNENNNKPELIYEMEEGKRNGLLISFYENGYIKSLRTSDIYSKSDYLEFYDSGVLKIFGHKINGRFDGWLYKFDARGKLVEKKYYNDGSLIE